MAQNPTRSEVVAQANDRGILNTEPALVRGAVVSVVGAVATILVISGVLDESQKHQLEENAGTIAVAVLVIVPILQSLWTRMAAYSPKTAAEIAVVNAAQPSGSVPTLLPPP